MTTKPTLAEIADAVREYEKSREHVSLSYQRVAEEKLHTIAPEALKALLTVAEAAKEIGEPTVVTDGQTRMECACCGNRIRASIKDNQHEPDCTWLLLQQALKALEA